MFIFQRHSSKHDWNEKLLGVPRGIHPRGCTLRGTCTNASRSHHASYVAQRYGMMKTKITQIQVALIHTLDKEDVLVYSHSCTSPLCLHAMYFADHDGIARRKNCTPLPRKAEIDAVPSERSRDARRLT
jgi:hypothetical protein